MYVLIKEVGVSFDDFTGTINNKGEYTKKPMYFSQFLALSKIFSKEKKIEEKQYKKLKSKRR